MAEKTYDILGIGNAILDILAQTDEATLAELGIPKDTMQLITAERAEELYDNYMGATTTSSGGSVANTVSGVAALGGSAAFIGKTKKDQFGKLFRHDMRTLGVEIVIKPLKDSDAPYAVYGQSSETAAPVATHGTIPATAQSYIFVTPDGKRTMNTYLGINTLLGFDDIVQPEILRAAKTVMVEGYLFDMPHLHHGLDLAAFSTQRGDGEIVLTLGDAGCVERNRAAMTDFFHRRANIVFANEKEIGALLQTQSFAESLTIAVRETALHKDNGGWPETVVLTHGAEGSWIVSRGEMVHVPAMPFPEGKPLVSTNGAGDAYAAGFLFGYTHGYSLKECGELGALCAARVITTLGARPEQAFRDLPEFAFLGRANTRGDDSLLQR